MHNHADNRVVGQHIVCIDAGTACRQYKQLVGGAAPNPAKSWLLYIGEPNL